MFAEIMSAVSAAFAAPLSWFVDVITSLSAEDVYLAVVFITLAGAFLLKPLRGSGSDRAKKTKNEESDDS